MPLPRFEKLDSDRQRTLLEAGIDEFGSYGFEGASYNRIIEASGVSKGAMYYYFEDKADLYATILRRAALQIGAAVGDLGPVTTPEEYWTELAGMLRRSLELFERDPHLVDLARTLYSASPSSSGGRSLAELIEFARGWVARTLRVGQGVGAVRDDVPLDLLTSTVTSTCVGMDRWFAEHWNEYAADELEALGAKALELCRHLVAPTHWRDIA